MTKGTAKTLEEAIGNGFEDLSGGNQVTVPMHVRDFLAQKFQAAYLLCQTEREQALLDYLCDAYGVKRHGNKKFDPDSLSPKHA